MWKPPPALTPERVLHRLEWQVIRRLDGRLQGDYRTLLRGHGTDFRNLRHYEWGDDVRHVDWNVTARMDELFVREFMEDRELTAWLLLDRSRSMAFGAVERTKERVLCELAATICQLFVRGGNRVGAVVYDGDGQWTIPPRQGRNQVLTLVRELLRPAQWGSTTDLSRLLDNGGQVGPPTISRRPDLRLHQRTRLGATVLRLAERHEVVAVRRWIPASTSSPTPAFLYVQDAETGEQLLVDSSDPELRRRLLAAARTRRCHPSRRSTGPGRPQRRVDRRRSRHAFVRMAGAATAPP